METIAEKPVVKILKPIHHATIVAEKKSRIRGLNWQAQQFEKARFGWMAIMLTFQSCLGAVACLFISMNPSAIFPLAVSAAVTMGSNALFIALAPPKVCLVGFYTSVILNLAIIVLMQI